MTFDQQQAFVAKPIELVPHDPRALVKKDARRRDLAWVVLVLLRRHHSMGRQQEYVEQQVWGGRENAHRQELLVVVKARVCADCDLGRWSGAGYCSQWRMASSSVYCK